MTDRHFQVSQLICFLYYLTCKPLLSTGNLLPVYVIARGCPKTTSPASHFCYPYPFNMRGISVYRILSPLLYRGQWVASCCHQSGPQTSIPPPGYSFHIVMSMNKVSKGQIAYRQEGKNRELGVFVRPCTWIVIVGRPVGRT